MLLGERGKKCAVSGVHCLTQLVVILSMFFVAVFCTSAKGETSKQKMMQLIQKLDQLDKMDLNQNLEAARNCMRREDFSCAASKIEEARKYAHSSEDHELLLAATKEMEKEQQRVKEELARKEAERRELERLAREAREAEERLAEEEREMERERRRYEEEIRLAEAQPRDDTNYALKAFVDALDASTASLPTIEESHNQLMESIQQMQREQQEKERERRRRKEELQRISAQKQQEYEQRIRLEEARREREEQARREAEQRHARQEELERERARQQREKELRIAQQEEEKRQKEAEAELAKGKFLAAMKSGIRLGAKNCYGESTIGGVKPSYPGGGDYCIDVDFTAYCPGQSSGTSGRLDYFTGFDVGCFGDGTKIPKVACDEKDLRVVVDRVGFCD